MICTLFPIFASAQEPYAILIDDGTALEFRYDDQKSAYRDAMDIGPFTEPIQRGWDSSAEGIYSVVFNESFADCSSITSTAYWFAGLNNLETFIGLDYLNTSNVTNMYMMFYGCTNLTDLDLSHFNTQNVTDMTLMFGSCNALTTIIAGSDWTTDRVEESGSMFESCFSLVGGNGTTFSQMNTDASYAHIDSENYPGYLTGSSSGDEPYWQELNYMIEYGADVLVRARESGNVEQWMLEELEKFLEEANEMYNTHEADADEVRHMVEELDWRIREVEEAMNPGEEASEETWEKLQSLIDYGSDLLPRAKESGNVDQWLLEELEMTLNSAQEMYKTHEATEEEVLNMIDDLDWRIREVEEAMKGGGEASEEAWAELHEAVEAGDKLLTEAREVSSVEPWALEELEKRTVEGSLMYEEHTANEDEVRHMTEELWMIINEVEEMMHHDPQGDASFDGLTAWVSGNFTLDDAFESVGGREVAAKTIAAIVWDANEALTADMLDGIDNPNLLVFVSEASKAPAGVQNVVIDGVAEEIILTDATGNNNFYSPQSFTAKSISYSRDFSQTTEIEVSRGWETIALPFDVQSITHESHGTLVPFGGDNNGYHFWLRKLSDNGLTRATQIEANKPYIISMPNNTVYPSVYNQNGTVTFSSTDVTVPETWAQSDSYNNVTLHAAFQQVEQGNSVYALNVGEARGDHPEGSVFEQNYRDIRPFQAYTTHSAGTRHFITLESLGGGNGDATGIDELRMESGEWKENVWYSLDGHRLDAKPTKKGVYVKDGRKIVIK